MGNDIDKIAKEIVKEINRTKQWIGQRAADKMRKKLIHVYDCIMDDFYKSYTPTSYRRHDVTPFTNEGINLHRALATSSSNRSKLRPGPHLIDGGIKINANDMKDFHYKQDKELVLKYVLDGVRFPSVEIDGIYRPAMEFVAHYEDSECSAIGTPLEVLNSIRDQLAEKYIKEAKSEAKKELNLKYTTL